MEKSFKCPKCGHDASLHYNDNDTGVAVCAASDWVYRYGGLTGGGQWVIGQCPCQTRNKRVLAKAARSRAEALERQQTSQ